MRRSTLAVGVMASWLLTGGAFAQTPPAPTPAPPTPAPTTPATPPPAAPTDPNLEAAKTHFEQGVALFNDQNFNAALAEFLKAYELHPTPVVLYNIGLTQKALFRYSEAIDSLEKYLSASPNMAPERRAEVEQQVREMKALLADVNVQVEPQGANVAVDGRVMGQAPLPKPLGVAAGNHTIEISADGYKPQKREILVSAGVPLTLSFRLEAIPRTGRVHITTSVPQATVAVDGRTLGVSPQDVELTPGGHTVEVAAPKYQLDREEVVIAAGQNRNLLVQLSPVIPPKHFYQKWYFWTPVALVVAGAAVGLGVGFGTRQSPLEGTLPPGVGGAQ